MEPGFHMVEINKQTHKEIYKDLKNFEQENVQVRMDFYCNKSPFVNLKSVNCATQEQYTQSNEFERWTDFCYDSTHEGKNIIKFSAEFKETISHAH